jgi:hypothetical protein
MKLSIESSTAKILVVTFSAFFKKTNHKNKSNHENKNFIAVSAGMGGNGICAKK